MVIGAGHRGMGGTLILVMGLGDDRVRFEWSMGFERVALIIIDRMYIYLRSGDPGKFDIYRLTWTPPSQAQVSQPYSRLNY